MLAQRDMGPTLSVAVDFQKLLEAPEFADVQLAAEIRDSPATILRTMGLAIFQIIREVLTTALSQATASDAPGQTPQGEAAVPYVHVREVLLKPSPRLPFPPRADCDPLRRRLHPDDGQHYIRCTRRECRCVDCSPHPPPSSLSLSLSLRGSRYRSLSRALNSPWAG